MRIPRLWLVLGVLLLIPAAAHADDHRARAYAALSNKYGSALPGFYASFDYTLPKPDNRDVSVLADFGVYSGSDDDIDVTHRAFMFGGAWTIFPKPDQPHLFSVHGLLGIVNTDDEFDIEDGNHFAYGGGVAWDFVPGRSQKEEGWGMRTQFDVIVRTRPDDDDGFVRLSVGAIYRFKH